MSLITQIQSLATRIASETKAVRTLLNGNAGDLSALTTTDKTNVVQAINEVKADIGAAQGETDLSVTTTATTVDVLSSTGADATIPAATGAKAGVMTAAQNTKLTGVATGATANATNAQLRDRGTHTGTQAIGTVTGLQTALDDKLPSSQKGAANGVASLDGGGKVPSAQLPSSVTGGLNYQGTWNAATNTPALTSGSGTKGHYYVVSTAGSTNVDGETDWKVKDQIQFNGATWDKIDNTESVVSVNGATGAVTGLLEAANNLSDVNNPATARTSLSVYSKAEIGDPSTNFVTTFEAAL